MSYITSYNALHKAIFGFWQGYTLNGKELPVYYTGRVPADEKTDEKARLPYITFEVMDLPAFGKTVLTATAWISGDNSSVLAGAAAFFDQVKARLPLCGVKCACEGGGFLLLYPNETNFLSTMTDPEDREIIGARVSYEAYYYR